MAKGYEIYLDKLVTDSIEIKGLLIDMLCGVKELSGKLDTLISLEQGGQYKGVKNCLSKNCGSGRSFGK